MIQRFMRTRTPQQLLFMVDSWTLHFTFVPAAIFAQTMELSVGVVFLQSIVLMFQILAHKEISRQMAILQSKMNFVKDVVSTIRRAKK